MLARLLALLTLATAVKAQVSLSLMLHRVHSLLIIGPQYLLHMCLVTLRTGPVKPLTKPARYRSQKLQRHAAHGESCPVNPTF